MIIDTRAKGSSQKFTHRGQTKEFSYGTLPPPPVLKRKCDRQWEKCMAGLLQRSSVTTHKGVHRTLVTDRRYRFPMKSSFYITSCSNNAVCLTHAGTRFPWGLASIAKRTRRQSRSIEEEYDFYSFFLSACSKADGRCKSIRYRTGASACAFNLAFKSSIDIYRLTASACMHLPPWRSGNDPEHFF